MAPSATWYAVAKDPGVVSSSGLAVIAQRETLSLSQERTAKKLLLEHIDCGIRISDVAKACCLSRSHFSRAFKNCTGSSPRDWLTTIRLARAKSLLEHTDLPISTISLDCGFADQPHFSRAFSRKFGVSPGRWRLRTRGD
jgi:transcriptional regulator GlxA family with amidase domain